MSNDHRWPLLSASCPTMNASTSYLSSSIPSSSSYPPAVSAMIDSNQRDWTGSDDRRLCLHLHFTQDQIGFSIQQEMIHQHQQQTVWQHACPITDRLYLKHKKRTLALRFLSNSPTLLFRFQAVSDLQTCLRLLESVQASPALSQRPASIPLSQPALQPNLQPVVPLKTSGVPVVPLNQLNLDVSDETLSVWVEALLCDPQFPSFAKRVEQMMLKKL